jgi:hypothetical protein
MFKTLLLCWLLASATGDQAVAGRGGECAPLEDGLECSVWGTLTLSLDETAPFTSVGIKGCSSNACVLLGDDLRGGCACTTKNLSISQSTGIIRKCLLQTQSFNHRYRHRSNRRTGRTGILQGAVEVWAAAAAAAGRSGHSLLLPLQLPARLCTHQHPAPPGAIIAQHRQRQQQQGQCKKKRLGH